MTVPHYQRYINGTWRDAANSLFVQPNAPARIRRQEPTVIRLQAIISAVCICGPDWHT